MKVSLISNEGGGISAVSKGIGLGLSKRKIYTTIFTGARYCDPHSERLNEYLEIIYLPNLNFPPRNLLFQVQNIRKILAIECSIIHGVSPDASFALTLFNKHFSKPYITTMHDPIRSGQRIFLNQPFNSWNMSEFAYYVLEYPLNYYALKKSIESSDHTTFCSYSVLEDLKPCMNIDPNKTSVIYNGVDFDEIDNINPSPRSTNELEDEISIMYAGRLYWSKGVMFLLHAFNLIKNDLRGVHLKIFGRGPLESKIDSFILKSGLKDKVTRYGHVPKSQIISELKKTDIVVFPSLSEAQSIFMLETMACKKPLIAFDLPFAREVMTNMETGLLTKPGDLTSLSEGIKLLVNDKKLRIRLGEAGYEYAKKNHNWQKQTGYYLEAYEKAFYHFKKSR